MTHASPQEAWAGRTNKANIGIIICINAAKNNVYDIPRGLNNDTIHQIIITIGIVTNSNLAGLSSLPIIPIAPFAQAKINIPASPIHQAKR